ncbi:MAG: hypothetical protein K2Q28_04115 [Hyphomicrobium sp.]|nr:hypothetical protein [Hyphomicrobium sp.]
MRMALVRQIVALVTVVFFTAGTVLSAAASTPHVHQDGEMAIQHGHSGHHPHAGDSHDHVHAADRDQAIGLDQAPDNGGGSCNHPQHGCFHTHTSCCVTALVTSDNCELQPPRAASKMAWSFDDLPTGRMTHPLLRPPRPAV